MLRLGRVASVALTFIVLVIFFVGTYYRPKHNTKSKVKHFEREVTEMFQTVNNTRRIVVEEEAFKRINMGGYGVVTLDSLPNVFLFK